LGVPTKHKKRRERERRHLSIKKPLSGLLTLFGRRESARRAMPPKSRSEALLAELRREAQARLQRAGGGGGGGVGGDAWAVTTAKQSAETTDASAAAGAAAQRKASKRPHWDEEDDDGDHARPAAAPAVPRRGGRWDDDDDGVAAAPRPPPPPPPFQAGRPPAPPAPLSASERAMAEAAAFKAMMTSTKAEREGAEEQERWRRKSPSLLANGVDAPADDDGEEEEEEEEEGAAAAAAQASPAAAAPQNAGEDHEREESLERALEEASVRSRERAAAEAAGAKREPGGAEGGGEGGRAEERAPSRWGDGGGGGAAAAAAAADASRQEEEEEEESAAAEATAAETAAAAAAAAPRPPPRPPRPPQPPSSSPLALAAPLRQPCRSVDSFERLAKVSEGTYGVVYKARDRSSGEIVALKKIKMDPGVAGAGGSSDASQWGFPLTSIREINVLLSLDHENIVRVSEVVVGGGAGAGSGAGSDSTPSSSVYLAMEWCDHDLCALQEAMRRPFTIAETKCVMRQLLAGVAHLHDRWFLHRDIKTANILYSNRGGRVKLADFGLARAFGSPLRAYTQPVVTLYYRAPELLLRSKLYSSPVDVWSLGCVMGELLLGRVMLSPDKSYSMRGGGGDAADDGSIAQMNSIAALLGPVDESTWPGSSALPGLRSLRYPHRGRGLRSLFPAPGVGGGAGGGAGGGVGVLADASQRLSERGIDLMSRMLCLDPSERISAAKALEHPWFDEFPRATEAMLMPTFPESERR